MAMSWREAKEGVVAQYLSFSEKGGWLVEVISILAIAVLITLFLNKFLRWLSRRALFQRTIWRHTCIVALGPPVILAVWALSASLVLSVIQWHGHLLNSGDFVVNLRNSLLAIALGWLALRWKSGVERALLLKIREREVVLARTQVEVVGRLVAIAVVFTTLLLCLEAFHIDIRAILAVGGIGSIAIGFAGKDVFSNFFSGFMIYTTRPFSVGDLILSPDRKIEGYVEAIGWYLTCIRSLEKRPIYVPNSLFSTIVVVNSSRMTHRRIQAELALRYTDLQLIPEVVASMQTYLRNHPAVDHHQRSIACFTGFGSIGLTILVDCFCMATDWAGWLTTQQELLLGLAKITHDHGADLTIPITAAGSPSQLEPTKPQM
jgi:MscS family membrane protein